MHVVGVDSPDVVRLDDGALVPFAVRVTDVDGRLLAGATVDAVMSPSRASDPVASALALDGVARMQLVEHGVYRFCARLDDVSTDAVLARVERGGEVTCVVDADVRLTIVASWLDGRARTQCGVLPAGREVLIHREGDELTVGVPRRSWMLVRLGSRFFVIEGGVESRSVTIPGDACARTLTVRDGDDRALGGMLFVVAKEELAPGVRSAWFGRMGGEAAVADLADGEYRCVLKSSDSVRVLADLRVYDGDENLIVEPPLSEEPERRASSGFIGLTVHGNDGRQCIPLFSVEHSGARVSLAEGVELIE